MTDYRVYFLGESGHLFKAVGLDCTNDKAAIEYTKQFIDGHDLELWQGDRQVTVLKSDEQNRLRQTSRMAYSWKKTLRCPVCRTTGVASLTQRTTDDHPTFKSVPEGFKVVRGQHSPNFHCANCGVPAVL